MYENYMYVMKPTEQRKGKIWQKFYFVYEEKAVMKQKTLSTLASTATKYTHTKHKTETVFGTKNLYDLQCGEDS